MVVPAEAQLESIATASLGDLRQAISQLQMCMLGQTCCLPAPSASDLSSFPDPEAGSRDKSYSFLHGVGKLLWAKVSTAQEGEDPHTYPCTTPDEGEEREVKPLYRLKFPPDSVIRRLALPVDISMSFLQFNYPAIFEQMQDKHEGGAQGGVPTPPPAPPLPQPTFDSLERAERFSEMMSEADMLYTCQFSTNLPLDRAESSSFPKGELSIVIVIVG